MPGRKAAKIDPADLIDVMIDNLRKVIPDAKDLDELGSEELLGFGSVERDVVKVDFSTENLNGSEEFGVWAGLLGPMQRGNLSWYGFMVGGDWEQPLYLIIYLDQDGKTLRGYIPNDGNPWNKKTKRAYGNDEEADAAYLKTLGFEDPEEEFDEEKLLADITGRIQVVG
jgi:hypothetical protein